MGAPELSAAARLCVTAAERACLEELRTRSGVEDSPIERHSARVFVVMEQLARRRGLSLDREVALCASLLHDAGLYATSRRRFYLARGRDLAVDVLAPHGWTAERLKLCLDAVELHHRLTPQWERGPEVELLRVADLVDGSAGVIRSGLDRAWLRALFRRIPRKGLYPELLRHSVRGAPCVSRALAGALAYPLQRRGAPRPR